MHELPGSATVASLIHQGSYDHILDAYRALMAWPQANGYHGRGGPKRPPYGTKCLGGVSLLWSSCITPEPDSPPAAVIVTSPVVGSDATRTVGGITSPACPSFNGVVVNSCVGLSGA